MAGKIQFDWHSFVTLSPLLFSSLKGKCHIHWIAAGHRCVGPLTLTRQQSATDRPEIRVWTLAALSRRLPEAYSHAFHIYPPSIALVGSPVHNLPPESLWNRIMTSLGELQVLLSKGLKDHSSQQDTLLWYVMYRVGLTVLWWIYNYRPQSFQSQIIF